MRKLDAGFGFDTAENELSKVWPARLLPACVPSPLGSKKQPCRLARLTRLARHGLYRSGRLARVAFLEVSHPRNKVHRSEPPLKTPGAFELNSRESR